jgi:hypothetical protein
MKPTIDPDILADLFLTQALNLAKQVIPPLVDMLVDMGIQQLKNSLLPPGGCPPTYILDKLIAKRNNILSVMNPIGETMESIVKTLPTISTVVNTSQTAATAASVAIQIIETTLTSGIPPVAPSPVVSGLSVAKTTLDKQVIPALTIANVTLSGLETTIKVVYNIVKKIIDMLNSLDLKINECTSPIQKSFNPLTPLSPFLAGIPAQVLADQPSTNQYDKYNTTYNGWKLVAVTGSYSENSTSPKLTRVKAIGKNAGDIVLLETDWSFTTNPQPLIEELKFRINKDNLKAY